MTRLPQVLVNVPVEAPMPDAADRFADEIAAVEAELGGQGRVLVRPSGTEPLVRVMVEAPTEAQADAAARSIAAAVELVGVARWATAATGRACGLGTDR